MAGFTKDEAMTFIEAIRLSLEGKVGFKWLVEKLSSLAAYIESITAENERLNAYVEQSGARDDYESYCLAHPSAASRGDAPQEG